MARKNQTPPKSFEDALAELERILGDIEGGQVPLEQSLLMYERGQFLIQHCRTVLARAEKQIEILGKAESGEPASQPMAGDVQDDESEGGDEENAVEENGP